MKRDAQAVQQRIKALEAEKALLDAQPPLFSDVNNHQYQLARIEQALSSARRRLAKLEQYS